MFTKNPPDEWRVRAKGLVAAGSVLAATLILAFGVLLGGEGVGAGDRAVAGDAKDQVSVRRALEDGGHPGVRTRSNAPGGTSGEESLGLPEGASGFAAPSGAETVPPAPPEEDGERARPSSSGATAAAPPDDGTTEIGAGADPRDRPQEEEPAQAAPEAAPTEDVPQAPSEQPAAEFPREEHPPGISAAAGGSAVPTAAPADNTLYLTVPKLGLYGVPVLDENSEEAMAQGANHIPQTGFPWEAGSNTYVSGHRLGFPGTGSDRIFYDLPSLTRGDEVIVEDSGGTRYEYRVTEALEVSPEDVWVVEPVPGRDVVSLQTCIEDFGDPWTIGPDWEARYVVRADRVNNSGSSSSSSWGL